jgi:hypothetical protein
MTHGVGNIKSTRWFKYDRDYLCVNKSQFVPVIFEPPCMLCYFVLRNRCVCESVLLNLPPREGLEKKKKKTESKMGTVVKWQRNG